jgi:DNA-binding NarL/FixJ family response regulator
MGPIVGRLELIRLQKSLGKDKVIAKKLGVTRQHIQQLREKYGIKSIYANNAKRNQEIYSLYTKGKPAIEIATKFGLTVSHTWALIAGVRGRKKELSDT